MKKLSLLLALILIITAFAGCNKKESAKSEPTVSEIIAPYLPDTPLLDKDVDFIGRFKEIEGGWMFAYSGSTIRAGFVGSEISATFEQILKYQNTDFLEIIIDGTEHNTLELYPNSKRSHLLAWDLEYGYHTIEIIKRTEQLSSIAFYGFDFSDNCYPAPAPARKDKRIMVIGDSITSGYGIMRMNGDRGFYYSEQDVQKTYGYLVAQKFNAEADILGISSAGAYKNPVSGRWNTYGCTAIPDAYTIPEEDMPDLVIINIGTIDNHGSIDDRDYEKSYESFIKEIRATFPDAAILCTIGGITNEPYPIIEKVVGKLKNNGDNNIYSYKIIASRDDENCCGGDFHPNANGHAAMAEELILFIQNNIEF